jgi:catechol 2,3-dioxygenase-like lactoylglutathione lyase family enzyme
MDTGTAAERWARTWERAWPAKRIEDIDALYADDATYRSHPLRDAEPGGAQGYLRRELASESDIECRFGDPIASDSRAAVEWWASWEEAFETVTLAGTTVLRFDADGQVVEHVDYWVQGEGRPAPFDGWGRVGAGVAGAETAMAFRYELTILPVADVDRAKAFYGETLGWNVDVDHRAGERFRVVQVTPPGSSASVSFGTGISSAEPGSYRGMHLVVDDIVAAHALLASRGVEVGEPFHFGPQGQTPGVDPERAPFASFLAFTDPDGNGWMVQEVGRGRG